jgi:hypothetical protein
MARRAMRNIDRIFAFFLVGAVVVASGCVTSGPGDEPSESTAGSGASLRVGTRVVNFLVQDGFGTEDQAKAYYLSNDPSFVVDRFTLDDFKSRFIGARPVKTGLYRNANDLGFWRQMTCTETLGRGEGGCMVSNFDSPDTTRQTDGTVAMRISDQGFVQFFAFNPEGKLAPAAVLDDEGPKFVPNLCTVCHAGDVLGPNPDLGSIFREFEPSLLERRPGITRAVAENEWFDLNQSIRTANRALRSEAEGGPSGIDHAKEAMDRHVGSEMYATTSPVVSRDVHDPTLVPLSWQSGGTAREADAKKNLWINFVSPYCMACHRTNSLDFSDYVNFDYLASQTGPKALLLQYVQDDASDPAREQLPIMPQAKLTYTNFRADTAGPAAVIDWITKMNHLTLIDSLQVGHTIGPKEYCTKPAESMTTDQFDANAGDRLTFTVHVQDARITGPQNRGDGVPLARMVQIDEVAGHVVLRPIADPAVYDVTSGTATWTGTLPSDGRYTLLISQVKRTCATYTVSLRRSP